MDNVMQPINKNDVLVGVDIGSHKIKVVMGALEAGGVVRILAVGDSALKMNGSSNDLQTKVKALKEAVSQAEQLAGVDIKNVYVGISGNNLRVTPCNASVTVETGKVSQSDIELAVKKATDGPVSGGSVEIIHTFRIHFQLDDQPITYQNPIDMTCTRLTAHVSIVTAPKNELINVREAIEQAGLNLEGFVLEAYAAGLSTLDEEERELGIAVLDIGSESSDLAVFKNDAVIHANSLPAGGFLVTSDIPRSFGIPIALQRAEEIKIKSGTCAITNLIEDETILVPGLGGRGEVECSRKKLAVVMQARFKQIFELYKEYLTKWNLLDSLGGGIVLTGGCAAIEGIDQLAAEVFGKRISVRCGKPHPQAGLTGNVENSDCAVCVGLLEYAALERAQNNKGTTKQPIVAMKTVWQRIVETLKKFT